MRDVSDIRIVGNSNVLTDKITDVFVTTAQSILIHPNYDRTTSRHNIAIIQVINI